MFIERVTSLNLDLFKEALAQNGWVYNDKKLSERIECDYTKLFRRYLEPITIVIPKYLELESELLNRAVELFFFLEEIQFSGRLKEASIDDSLPSRLEIYTDVSQINNILGNIVKEGKS